MVKPKNILISFALSFSLLSHSQTYDITTSVTQACETLDAWFILTTYSGVTSAEWDFGNGTTYSGLVPPVVSYDSVGLYDVSVVINGTETITKNEYINIFPRPVADFTTNDSSLLNTYNIYMEAERQPEPFDTVQYTYNWTYGDGQTFTTTTPVNSHHYNNAGNYTITLNVSDNHGCVSSSQETITVVSSFYVPNIFTPNGDAYNNTFTVETDGRSEFSMTIFSRYGTLVYKTKAPVLMWDGNNNNGEKVSPGIYFYVIEEKGGAGRNQTGFVYVIY